MPATNPTAQRLSAAGLALRSKLIRVLYDGLGRRLSTSSWTDGQRDSGDLDGILQSWQTPIGMS
jgi:hypothetical protein